MRSLVVSCVSKVVVCRDCLSAGGRLYQMMAVCECAADSIRDHKDQCASLIRLHQPNPRTFGSLPEIISDEPTKPGGSCRVLTVGY
jgi:hypothetical protein